MKGGTRSIGYNWQYITHAALWLLTCKKAAQAKLSAFLSLCDEYVSDKEELGNYKLHMCPLAQGLGR